MISPDQFRSGLSKVIRAGILVVVLLIFASFANVMPGVKTEIVSGLSILGAIRLGLVIVSIVVIGGLVGALRTTVAYYASLVFRVYRDPIRAQVAPNIKQAAGGISGLVVIAVIWALINQSLPIVLRIEPLWEFDWLPTAVTLFFVLGVLLVLIGLYRSSGPIFELVSGALSTRVAAGTQVRCPSCGAVNSIDVRFCTSCGKELERGGGVPQVDQVLRCRNCGAENAPSNKFCANCGTQLSMVSPEGTTG